MFTVTPSSCRTPFDRLNTLSLLTATPSDSVTVLPDTEAIFVEPIAPSIDTVLPSTTRAFSEVIS